MAKAPAQTADLPLGEPTLVSPEILALDVENPRLMLSANTRPSDDSIIRQLHREGELSELLQSIAANGYLDFEPLVVLQHPKGPFTVVEGNRRLAAVKLLRSPALAQRLEIQIPPITQENRNSLDLVRVIRVASRSDSRTFIAFKHINGPHRWDSYAKAKYAASWYEDEKRPTLTHLSLILRNALATDTTQSSEWSLRYTYSSRLSARESSLLMIERQNVSRSRISTPR